MRVIDLHKTPALRFILPGQGLCQRALCPNKYMAVMLDCLWTITVQTRCGHRKPSQSKSWKAAQVVVACISKVANTMQMKREDICCSQMSSKHQDRPTLNCSDRKRVSHRASFPILAVSKPNPCQLPLTPPDCGYLQVFLFWTKDQTVASHSADVRTSLVSNWVCN